MRPRRPRVTVDVKQLNEIVDKADKELLSSEECDVLRVSINAMAERISSQSRTSEKARQLLQGGIQDSSDADGEQGSDAAASGDGEPKKPRPGHGRNGASVYGGARFVTVGHPDYAPKCRCVGCEKGKLYELTAKTLVRITGMPPVQAVVYQLQNLRCNLCGQLYPAPPPDGVGDEKYDATVASMIAQLKYGSGMTFYRIAALQQQMGVPLPATTQWELVEEAAKALEPVYDELTRQAAQGEVLHHDDTSVRILDGVVRPDTQDEDRSGIYTTGIVAKVGAHQVALYISGGQHAGENISDILAQRAQGLQPAVLMSDALAANNPKLPPGVETLMGNCLTHGRRQFVDVLDNFPEACHHVIVELGLIYWHDEQAQEKRLSPQERMQFHQEHSGPVMDALKAWMSEQLEKKLTEPNSGLGKAINYFLKRWDRLTLFLRFPGAPLDNNVVERALKRAVLHRKNALFYKTEHGAAVGDLYMSLIHTCELNKVNSFEYMTVLQRHAAKVKENPGAWLPWNYHLQLPSDSA